MMTGVERGHAGALVLVLVVAHGQTLRKWIVVDARVYDISHLANLHPGGRANLVDSTVTGTDATEAFYGLHHHEVLDDHNTPVSRSASFRARRAPPLVVSSAASA